MSNVFNALEALIKNYNPANGELVEELRKLFDGPEEFLKKVKDFDQLFEKAKGYEAVQEYAFDLLMAYHLELNNSDPDYFDSREWQDIEDKTLERGTELLNILLYISEARDTDVPVNIEDFLYEFLLVDEDEFQDEHRIYEELIANQELVEEDFSIMVEAAKRIPDELEIKELFLPLLAFFSDPAATGISKEQHGKLQPVESALLGCMLAYVK